MNDAKGLTLEDFVLDGQYGSQGARLEQLGFNHFLMTLGTAPNNPTWTNKPQFEIRRNARGNRLRLEVAAPVEGGGRYPMNEYSYSWSYDNDHWQPIAFETEDRERNTIVFPEFTEDQVYFGHQVPLSYEKMIELIQEWRKDPRVAVHTVGESLAGRPLYRLVITDPDTDAAPLDRRWGHYFVNVHPGEHNAQWRIIGMIDWLLNDPEARSYLQRSINHFVIMMSADGPANGWYRVNGQGVDMNRSYCHTGSAESQAHEAYVHQRDFEALMASDQPIHTIWNMHTWRGIVEPILYPGPEMSGVLGDWTVFRDIMVKNDPQQYIKPLRTAADKGKNPMGLDCGWNGGPQHQFGITGVLCEGGSTLLTKEANMDSGKVIIRSLSQYYTGLRQEVAGQRR